MYPFLQLKHTARDKEGTLDSTNSIVEQLEAVTRKFKPFQITLDRLGTFGGKRRGVLWLKPSSGTRTDNNDGDASAKEQSPMPRLEELQRHLEDAFPSCKEKSKKGGQFVPHMTLSHFDSLCDAKKAQLILEESYPFIVAGRQDITNTSTNSEAAMEMGENTQHSCLPISFLCDRIYLLERRGDDGQFLRVAQIAQPASETKGVLITLHVLAPQPDVVSHHRNQYRRHQVG